MTLAFFFLISTLLSCNIHDVQVAFFNIHQEKSTLFIEVILEKEDLEFVFNKKNEELTDEELHTYLNRQFSIRINQQNLTPNYSQAVHEDKHTIIIAKYPLLNQKIKTIEIKNSVLIDIPDHANIIQVYLNEQQRDFLMDIGRTKINFDYE